MLLSAHLVDVSIAMVFKVLLEYRVNNGCGAAAAMSAARRFATPVISIDKLSPPQHLGPDASA